MKKALLAIPAIMIAMNAAAECTSDRLPEKPTLPAGEAATRAEMHEAQQAAQAYVDGVVEFVNCREKHLTDFEHNFYVHAAERMAGEYNTQLQAYQQAREAVAGY